jgi:type II/III secretion system protein
MKKIAALISILLLATALAAQEPESKLKTKMFDVHNRPAHDIALAVRDLGSSTKGTQFSWNDEMHTITVRDFPENIATIEEAIGRLDKPVPPAPDVQMRVSLLIGSTTALPGAGLPEDLAPVVKQLKSTLRYTHYGLLAANIHSTRSGNGIEGSGIAEPTLIGGTSANPIFYSYTLHGVRVESDVVSIEMVKFALKVPLKVSSGVQYQSVGFETPVSIKPNEKVVIGTTTMGDRAVIVVLMASVSGK